MSVKAGQAQRRNRIEDALPGHLIQCVGCPAPRGNLSRHGWAQRAWWGMMSQSAARPVQVGGRLGCYRQMGPDDTPAIETLEPASTRPTGGSKLAHLFHRINSIIPEAQEVVTVAPSAFAAEALALLDQHRFSQVPVVRGGEVLGSFSYRSFARRAVELQHGHGALGELPVEEFMEALDIAHATDELASIFAAVDRDDAVL